MRVILKNAESGESIEGLISAAEKVELPSKRLGWQFDWKKLGKTEGAEFYKLTLLQEPSVIEGLLMLTLINKEMMFMNNIEVASHNLGRRGKHDYVAGCLLAFGCYKSFEKARNEYLGYLSFESKTQLIALYQEKYGATLAAKQKMFFDPSAGKALMEKFLTV